MSTENAAASKARLIERAESRVAEEGMTWEDPLDIEVNGKYVDILFTTGGPHVEVQIEFAHGEGGEFWFEHAPMFGRVIYMDWGTREEVFLNTEEARLIQQAVMRDPDDLLDFSEGTTHTFNSSGSQYAEHDFEEVTIIRPLTADEADSDEVGPMYLVRFEDGTEGHVFQDEITERSVG